MTVIREIMNECVVTIRPDATLSEAAKTLEEHHVGGAPVVAEGGEVVGIISESEMLDMLFDLSERDAPVSKFMTQPAHVAHPDESLSRAAHMFELYGMHNLPVVDAGLLVGVVTRRDLLHYAIHASEPLTEPLAELIPGLENVF